MRAVVSFTTLPHRLGGCRKMVDSILGQTRKPDRIVLVLPDICIRHGSGYEIPSWFPEEIEILQAGRDLGSAMKLIPILREEVDPETRVITVDDDVVYHPELVEELVYHSALIPDCALGFMGCSSGGYYHTEGKLFPFDVEVLGGYRGILYCRKFFTDSIFEEIVELNKDGVFLADDQLFAWHLEKNRIKEKVIPTCYLGSRERLFEFLNLGGGIFEGDTNKSAPSVELVKKMFGK